jgi:hypothetical protein
MNSNTLRNGHDTGEWLDRLLEVGLWLAAGYVVVYSFAGLVVY